MQNNKSYHQAFNQSSYFAKNYIEKRVNFYCLTVILAIGIVGNLFSLFIFTRPNLNKKTNTGILFTFLCIVNLVYFFEYFVLSPHSGELFGFYILLYCNTEIFVRSCLQQILSWTQTLICFDRFIVVVFPSRANKIRNKVFYYYIILIN